MLRPDMEIDNAEGLNCLSVNFEIGYTNKPNRDCIHL